jgi:hypothetical protein
MAGIVYSMRLFDMLLRYQYTEWRDKWEADGQPSGFFWTPVVANSWKSRSRTQSQSIRWFYVTPSWIRPGSPEAKLLLRYRVVGGLIYLGFLSAFLRLHL